MKKFILIICLAVIGISDAHVQSSVIVRRPIRYVKTPAARTVMVSRPVRRLRPVITVVCPAARRRVAIVRR